MIVTSIDIGYKGGVAKHQILNNSEAVLIDFYPMPVIKTQIKRKGKIKIKSDINIPELITILQDSSLIVIEDIHSRPTDGKVSAFNFGYQKGLIVGLSIKSVGINNVYLIHPQSWKSKVGLIKKSKQDTIKIVNDLYNLTLAKKDDGIADAIMIGRAFILSTLNVKTIHPYR